MRISTNYTGDKNCSIPMSVSNPAKYAIIQDYLEGWEYIECTEVSMPNVDGKGSIFPTSETFTDYPFE